MSFSYKFKTLRSGNTYHSGAQLEMSEYEKEVTGEVEAGATEVNEENGTRISPDLVDEKIKASLETLHAQISACTEMMVRFPRSNSPRETTTASTVRHDTSKNRPSTERRETLVCQRSHHLPLRDTRPTVDFCYYCHTK